MNITVGVSSDNSYMKRVAKATTAAGVVELGTVIDRNLTYVGEKLEDRWSDKDGLSLDAVRILKAEGYADSNIETIMEGVDAVIFTGGDDISPKLYGKTHGCGTDFNPTHDASDFLLMSYCLDKDIPFLSICRGSQMLCAVSGGVLIRDVETYYIRSGMARFSHCSTYHEIDITDTESHLYRIYHTDRLEGMPSTHHQAVNPSSLEGTNLKVTATCTRNGIAVVEGTERTDKTFALGIQGHPETAYSELNTTFMSKENALMLFQALVNAAAAKQLK